MVAAGVACVAGVWLVSADGLTMPPVCETTVAHPTCDHVVAKTDGKCACIKFDADGNAKSCQE